MADAKNLVQLVEVAVLNQMYDYLVYLYKVEGLRGRRQWRSAFYGGFFLSVGNVLQMPLIHVNKKML